MKEEFDILKTGRTNLLRLTEEFSASELNLIPEGFANNLIWNMGHCLVTQQLLCYKLSGNEMVIDQVLIDKFRKGTKPEDEVSAEEIEYIRFNLRSAIDEMEKDFERGVFQEFQDYETSYGVELNSIEDAIRFNIAHENLHLGYIMALRRAVKLQTA